MFLTIDYQTWWLLATAILLLAYGVLDGYDLGAGAWHLFLKNEDDKQLAMKTIAPVWDGNEVFLIIGGGALFAGFPEVYATLFSAMYIPFMLFLLFLIARGVSIEFRNKEENKTWRKSFDIAYGVSSAVLAILLGVVVANVLQGMPLNEQFEFTGSWLSFLNPYALLVGLMSLAFAMVHGASYMMLKTEGDLHDKIHGFQTKAFKVFVLLFTGVIVWSIAKLGFAHEHKTAIYTLLIVIAVFVALLAHSVQKKLPKCSFIRSTIALLLAGALALVKLYPVIIPSTVSPDFNSLTIYNACASQKTYEVMLIVAAIGVPLMIGYVIFAYRVFWGKVKKEDSSY